MINVKNLNYKVKHKHILKNIVLDTKNTQITAIIGPNGAGKTTFIKLLRNFLPITSGQIDLAGKSIQSYKNKELSKLISYLPQTTKAVSCSVEDCILLGRKPHMKFFPKKSDYEKCEKIMDELHLSRLKNKNVLSLSGGELQKVLIARSLVQESDILFLDEPINHLDIKNQLEIMDITKKMTKQKKITTFVVLHDLNLAFKYADKILLLKDGENIFYGDKNEINEKILSSAYGVDIELIDYKGEKKVIY
ncbi:ABC transporter ATP-binding protein [Halarcobacter ebronensis]|uniref:Iron ABC transporter ATP-binding protein n=1 Tax=Halarcobacter ebronensis TaxID=1462615 RepID=A0A4Q1AGT6_9BACT|nr:ABC transporter ATP-binding protein [Halarcobacter ebronensis]QKF82978.1 iron siderophore ABC transporter, ATP-binding protein [Halarcobacter ebronensis]RXK02824.1 iron ABC transporter ATP-binding protein [Halarcobacter ebronensis]